jgi:DNA polymerase-3 subunit delta'
VTEDAIRERTVLRSYVVLRPLAHTIAVVKFAGVVGHAPVVAQLERAVRDATLTHATLLVGADGVGKTTLAEAVAAALLDAGSWPGGLTAHPDHWLEDSDAERISIERVRAGGEDGPTLQDAMILRPYAGGSRVAVIGRADRLTEQAANCVLKTLEEPPPQTHILLCAAHPERLPATITSRCQSFGCAPVPAAEVHAWLTTTHGVAPILATTAAHLCGGRPGRALSLATQPGALSAELDAIDAFLDIAGGGRAQVLAAAERLAPISTADGRERALSQLAAWTGFIRDVACLAAGAPELTVWEAYRPAASLWAETLQGEQITEILARCVESADQLAQYAVPRLCYEALFLDTFTTTPAPPRVSPVPRDHALAAPAATAAQTPRPARPRRRRA